MILGGAECTLAESDSTKLEKLVRPMFILASLAGSIASPISQGNQLDWKIVEIDRRPRDLWEFFIVRVVFGGVECVGSFGIRAGIFILLGR